MRSKLCGEVVQVRGAVVRCSKEGRHAEHLGVAPFGRGIHRWPNETPATTPKGPSKPKRAKR